MTTSRRDFTKWIGATVVAAPLGVGVAGLATLPAPAKPYDPIRIIYRTDDGPWGAGKSTPLTYAELDNNFYVLAQRITELEKKLAERS